MASGADRPPPCLPLEGLPQDAQQVAKLACRARSCGRRFLPSRISSLRETFANMSPLIALDHERLAGATLQSPAQEVRIPSFTHSNL